MRGGGSGFGWGVEEGLGFGGEGIYDRASGMICARRWALSAQLRVWLSGCGGQVLGIGVEG